MKKNNKGSAFVMVLVILAIVGILAAVSLWLSLVSYQMKLTDIKVKDNFYSAESVMDQICVGLQGDVSNAYQKAYNKIIVNYPEMNDSQRQAVFESQFKRELTNLLKVPGSSDMTYSLTKLKNYVYEELRNGTGNAKAEIMAVRGVSSNDAIGDMVLYDTSIVLKSIEVTYTDKENYTSKIQTDIVIKAPELSFDVGGTISDTFAYSIVGNSGIAVTGNVPISINGSVYAGVNSLVSDISLDVNGTVSFSNLKYLVSEGTVNVNKGGKLTVAPKSQFWTNNIVVDGNGDTNATEIKLEGETYVADDLTLKGQSPKATLGTQIVGSEVSGRYVGFGTHRENPSKSSAIILNGTNSKLDMEHLKELMLGGYSYINTLNGAGAEYFDWVKQKNVAMGESIAVKGGQLSYLVPPECIWVDNGTKQSKYKSNPISYAEYCEMYDDITSDNPKQNLSYQEVDGTIVYSTTLGKCLNDYLLPGQSLEEIISKVFVPLGNGEGLVYYYLNLSPENATKYSADYYQITDKNRLDMYTDFYTDVIKVNESSAVYTAGNYMLFDGTVNAKTDMVTSIAPNISNTLISYGDSFEALVRTLEPRIGNLTAETRTKKAYDNLIDEEKLKEAVQTQNPRRVTVGEGTDKLQAVLINGDFEYNSSENSNVSLIISTGNVTVTKDYVGTIIAKGKVTIADCNVNSQNGERMKNLLAAPIPDLENTAIYNIFKAGSGYLGGEGTEEGEGSFTGIGAYSYSDIITYQNWQKK